MDRHLQRYQREIGQTWVVSGPNFNCPKGYLIPATTMMEILGFVENKASRQGEGFSHGSRFFRHPDGSTALVATVEDYNWDFSTELVLSVRDHRKAAQALEEFSHSGGVLYGSGFDRDSSWVQLKIALVTIKFVRD